MFYLETFDVLKDDGLPVPELAQEVLDESLKLHVHIVRGLTHTAIMDHDWTEDWHCSQPELNRDSWISNQVQHNYYAWQFMKHTISCFSKPCYTLSLCAFGLDTKKKLQQMLEADIYLLSSFSASPKSHWIDNLPCHSNSEWLQFQIKCPNPKKYSMTI